MLNVQQARQGEQVGSYLSKPSTEAIETKALFFEEHKGAEAQEGAECQDTKTRECQRCV